MYLFNDIGSPLPELRCPLARPCSSASSTPMTGEQRGRDQAEREREVFRGENLPCNVYNCLLYTVCRDAVLARAECLERDQRGGGRDQLLITEDMTRPERIQVTLRHTASHRVTPSHTALCDKC